MAKIVDSIGEIIMMCKYRIAIGIKLACLIFFMNFGDVVGMEKREPQLWPKKLEDFFTDRENSNDITCDIGKVNPSDYIINFVWLNKTLNKDQKYLNSNKFEDYQTQLIDTLSGWHTLNKSTQIILWYDGLRTTETMLKIVRESLNHAHVDNVTFRDVQSLERVQKYKDLFTEDKLSIYFRADIVRLIILYELAKSPQSPRFLIYSDLNVPPIGAGMNQKQRVLFDDETIASLAVYGLVLATNKGGLDRPYENAFYIIDKTNETMIDLIDKIVIQTNLEKAKENLQKIQQNEKSKENTELDQVVWVNHLNLVKAYSEKIGLFFPIKGDHYTRKYMLYVAFFENPQDYTIKKVICPFQQETQKSRMFYLPRTALQPITSVQQEEKYTNNILRHKETLFMFNLTKDVDKPPSKFYK